MPGPGRPFEAGNQAGKGFGRPKGSGRIEVCRIFAENFGFKKLIELATCAGYELASIKGRPVRAKVVNGKPVELAPSLELQFEALKLALAYGCGKPTEFVDVSSGGQTLYEFLREQFVANGINGSSDNGHSVTASNGSVDPDNAASGTVGGQPS